MKLCASDSESGKFPLTRVILGIRGYNFCGKRVVFFPPEIENFTGEVRSQGAGEPTCSGVGQCPFRTYEGHPRPMGERRNAPLFGTKTGEVEAPWCEGRYRREFCLPCVLLPSLFRHRIKLLLKCFDRKLHVFD